MVAVFESLTGDGVNGQGVSGRRKDTPRELEVNVAAVILIQ